MDILTMEIPQIGFGPGGCGYSPKMKKMRKGLSRRIYNIISRFYIRPKQEKQYVESIANAIRIGYRLIDYSSAYGDGRLLGQAILKSKVDRNDLFITTRVSNKAQVNKSVRKEFLDFLNNTGLEYVDLLQFHWPVTDCYINTWREMEKLYQEGLVKNLGVANCHEHHIESILQICKYPPVVGQFEIHPLFTQKNLINYYKEKGIVVEAYTPIARYDDRLVRLPLLKRLEAKYKKDFVQIILRWHIQNGVIPLIRSLSPKHQKSNFQIFDFHLDDGDMQAIDAINISSRLRYDPDNCDFSIL